MTRASDSPADPGRRAMLAAGALLALGGKAAASDATPAAQPAPAAEPGAARRPKWGMTIDLDRCTGCGGCVVACRYENNIPVAGPEQAERDRAIFWMALVHETEGKFPEVRMRILPTPCNHCENPPCIKVCPVGATYKNDEGIVAQIWARCIGCRFCTVACPFTRRYFNWEAPRFSEEERLRLNPDVATRPVGVVEKCTFCHHRIRKLREQARADGRQLGDADFRRLPACAQACPADAISFGDLNDPESTVSRQAESPRASRLLEDLGTRPKVIYLGKQRW